MLESKVCQYEAGYTGILLVRCGLEWINSNFNGGTKNGGRSFLYQYLIKVNDFSILNLERLEYKKLCL